PVFHTIVSIKNDGHYFCRAGGNRPDGLNEPVTLLSSSLVLYCTNFEKTILHSSEEPPLQELRSFLFPTARIVTSPQRQGITK
ncbi:hypothetical protein, partial [Escherichia coli]